jgi:hypothetical protein
MRRQIMPTMPAATSRMASAPRIRSGSGNELASPGFSLSSARATPFGFGRPGLVVVAGGATSYSEVVGSVVVGSVVVAGVVVTAGAVVVVAALVVGAAAVVVGVFACFWSAIARPMARRMSSLALEYSWASVGRWAIACW